MTTNQFAGRDVINAGGDVNINNNVYPIVRVESIIADVINNLSKSNFPLPYQIKKSKLPLAVEQKIKLNNIKTCRNIIESYKPLSSYLNSVYSNLEKIRISTRERVLQRLQNAYINELNKYVNNERKTLDVVKANSDVILLGIKEQIKNIVICSSNNMTTEEDIDIALDVILADAFVSCQIMESEGQ
ncbi:TPA: hypothetical protein CPU00_10775 [Candidatus Gastranaerophilales bacterium HUM_18]|nr:MAG TPA: hypothetical protein CPU00_10775 [Candidatus Gastranaerophilales bacterium HUM_18]